MFTVQVLVIRPVLEEKKTEQSEVLKCRYGDLSKCFQETDQWECHDIQLSLL